MNARSLFVLGRLPAIGRAELESLLGASHVSPAGETAVLSDIPAPNIPFTRLGSSVKLAEYLGTIPATDMRSAQNGLNSFALKCAEDIPEGKIQLGVSAYGVQTSPQQLMAVGLNLKKTLRAHGYSVRLIPNEAADLSSAQVLHNHLVGERGIELIVVRDGTQLVVGRSVAVQDINAYAARDQGRPKRDARVGMLPPKLAQTIVNLAVGQATPTVETAVLDPFCGTGVVLQEASLMGFGIYGTDLEPRMIAYTGDNLKWLEDTFVRSKPLNDEKSACALEVGDATTHRWQPMPNFVASEVYLGQPLSSWPAPEKLRTIVGTCNVIIEKFLHNISNQLVRGTRLCLAVPAWQSPAGHFSHLPLLDHLAEMGYNRVSFEHVRTEELVYYRPDQLVARELLVITRN